jgi:hypothetical protein
MKKMKVMKEMKKQSEGLNVNNPQRSEAIGGRLITDRRLPFFGSRSKFKIFINMKKTTIFLMLTLIMMSAASVNAQVTIGSMNDPHRGAILDLSQSESNVGLLFPNVYLFNTHEFTLPADDGLSAKGMVIYNSNASLSGGAGLYAWNGSEWKSMNAGNANTCIPVTATAISEKTDGSNAKITINITAGNPTFSYVWTKEGSPNPVRTATNVSATSDSYTTIGEGIYTVTVTNPYTATPVSFIFEVSDAGETLVDNGNGTKTDSQGNLVYKGETYEPVKSDIPGIYLDKDGEIVYTGADGIPGTEDDDVYVTPDYPLSIQKTLFSIKYPVVTHQEGKYQIELDFANGLAYDGKIKYLSYNPDIIAVDGTGFMTVGPTSSTAIVVILEDGSVISSGFNVRSKIVSNGNKLAGVINAEATLGKGQTKKINVIPRAIDGSGNAYNMATLTYAMDDDGDTGSTVTPGGWFHAVDPGIATVTATATDDDGNPFTGTVTVTVLGALSEEMLPYEIASINWAELDPAPAYAGGDGTKDSPYQISSVRQFKKLAADIALLGSTEATYQKYFELTTDLDFSEDNTVTSSLTGDFYGTFDGKGHVIRDLHIDATGKSSVSLFSSLRYGEIKNLGREGGSTTGSDAIYISGLVAGLSSGKLSNCYNSSSINVNQIVGGLVAILGKGTTIQNCYNTGEIISSGYQTGGLVGTSLFGGGDLEVINSYNAGNVKGLYVSGGIAGNINASLGNAQFLTLTNFFNFGNITNKNSHNGVGSFIGIIQETNSALMEVNATNVYSRPDVVSTNNETTPKSNQPIGWSNTAEQTLIAAILFENPTMGENEKYSLDYSKTPAFAAELGDAFKYAPGRTPKLAWEK